METILIRYISNYLSNEIVEIEELMEIKQLIPVSYTHLYEDALDGISNTQTINPDALGHSDDERSENLVHVLDLSLIHI